MSHSAKITAFLLLLGLSLRLPTILEPITEGHRNAQTATLTAGMVEYGQPRFDALAPWRGDLNARLVQELPVYNMLALALERLPGITLDLAGRLASLAFWIVSFIALQALWRRALPQEARGWANLLFVAAPMNLYLSTAFMPESLVQFLSICFLISAVDYARNGAAGRILQMTIVATFGLLIKLPAFLHLGFFLAFVLVDRQGWKSLFRPHLLAACLLVVSLVALWSSYISGLNAAFFPYWTGMENLLGFIQPHVDRLSFGFIASLAGYNLAFVLPVIAAPFAIVGAASLAKRCRDYFDDRIWLYLAASLVIYWLVWAKGAAAQNYYNLPNLVLFSALFGIGMSNFIGWMKNRNAHRVWIVSASAAMIVLMFISGVAGLRYLSRPDFVVLEVSQWIKKHTQPDDLILFQPRHSPAVIDYEHQPLLSHLSSRRTWIWTRSTPEWEKQRALQTSRYAVITQPSDNVGLLETFRRSIKGQPAPLPLSVADDHPATMKAIHTSPRFVAYEIVKSGP